MNICTFNGNLVNEPKLKLTGAGSPVCDFTLAIDRDQVTKDGKRETDYIDMEAWNGAAEYLAGHHKKGDMIVVTGRLVVTQKGSNTRHHIIRVIHIYPGDKRTR